ncbi:hypothetical protein L1987_52136 [Smallanthus sonchifolius]|uniref:Uncharacterized protein n=1 Tax=Smallanthus sonchifolius TaxID=185202 RepID=A0ACB9ESB8_9ASTR|nr:hypothetical protein L1987_52136 [Smallanthus sonchifolius]
MACWLIKSNSVMLSQLFFCYFNHAINNFVRIILKITRSLTLYGNCLDETVPLSEALAWAGIGVDHDLNQFPVNPNLFIPFELVRRIASYDSLVRDNVININIKIKIISTKKKVDTETQTAMASEATSKELVGAPIRFNGEYTPKSWCGWHP